MKKILLPVAVAALMFSSCGGGGCDDLSTAKGAAACMCSQVNEAKSMQDDGVEKDSDEAKEMMANMKKYSDEIGKNIEEEKYSAEDYTKAMTEVDGCMDI